MVHTSHTTRATQCYHRHWSCFTASAVFQKLTRELKEEKKKKVPSMLTLLTVIKLELIQPDSLRETCSHLTKNHWHAWTKVNLVTEREGGGKRASYLSIKQ